MTDQDVLIRQLQTKALAAGGLAVSRLANDLVEGVAVADGTYRSLITPDLIHVVTAVSSQGIAFRYEGLWGPNNAASKIAIFIDGQQLWVINTGGNPVLQEAVGAGLANSARSPLYTRGDGLHWRAPLATHTAAATPGVPYAMQGDNNDSGAVFMVIQGLAAGDHVIEVKAAAPAGFVTSIASRRMVGFAL